MRLRASEICSQSPLPEQSSEAVPVRFASCAAGGAGRVALVDAGRALTYEELDSESTRLAIALQQVGAGPDRCVGLLTERSAHFVIAALAVLKSGAAYVPLDPSTPPDRVSWIFADAGVVAVVTSSALAVTLRKEPRPVLTLDRLGSIDATAFAAAKIDPESLAYVAYTSGSAGKPKGVEITHANLSNLVGWHLSAFAVQAADRASQVAGLGFDAAGWEVWPYLCAGASVWIADESTRRSAELLRRWIIEHRITIGFAPTALAEQLFQLDWPAKTSLRLLLTGGDALQHRPPDGLPFAVVNNYGPTECTVVATSAIVSPRATNSQRPSIGSPIANAKAFVLDDRLSPVPPGEAGELCIGGALVARGYRNMPDLTSTQFVTLMSASGGPLRAYRTGDRVRVLESGEIDFLGRMDDQVKIRGYRIELGEIAAWLREYPGVSAAAVSVADVAGNPALVAYLVCAAGSQLDEPSLRQYLAAKLPDYMVPSYFVALIGLPVTANGKLDKAALPLPTAQNALSPEKPPPDGNLTGLEQQIADLVASMIGRPVIGAEENFFMVGGHSMFGVQLVARIREKFGVQLPLRHVFAAPTIRELSHEVSRLIPVD